MTVKEQETVDRLLKVVEECLLERKDYKK